MAFIKVKGDLIQDSAITSDMLGADVPLGGPKISNVSIANSSYEITANSSIDANIGGFIIVTGENFASGAQVLINQNTSVSTSFVNTTRLNSEVPNLAAGTYNIYVVNSDGGTAIKVSALTYE